MRLLRSHGEDTESALIALLHHSDESVRSFAASSLSRQATDDVIKVFLIELESHRPAAEIGRHAPTLFFTHAKGATGPLTATDQRMIAWLKSELKSSNPDRSGHAAWAMTAFVNRDPSLRQSVAACLKNGTFFYKYLVLREMVDSDPTLRDEYVDVLFSGLGSATHADQTNALYGFANLKNAPDDARSRLESRRTESTDPGEISRIDQALEALRENDARQR